MTGIVACEALYAELDRLVPDAEVRYVPQEFHEFPVDVAQDAAVTEHVQAAVDELDEPGRDRIVLLYANGAGLRGVRTEHADLVVSRADDCISLFVHDVEPWSMGEPKEFGTYYLSRGWIDCGVDSYKLFSAYTGGESDLEARFAAAAADHPDMRVTWADGDRYRRAVEKRDGMSREMAGRFFHEIVRYYERVKLIDTGTLYDFHRAYADEFADFIEDLSAEHGDGHAVERATIEGDDALLRTVLSAGRDTDHEYVDVYAPGEPVA